MVARSEVPHHIPDFGGLGYSEMLDVLVCFFVAKLNLSDDGQDFLWFEIVDLHRTIRHGLFCGDGCGVVGGFTLLGFCKWRFGHFEQFRSATGCQQHGRDSSDGEQRCLKSSECQFLSSHNR